VSNFFLSLTFAACAAPPPRQNKRQLPRKVFPRNGRSIMLPFSRAEPTRVARPNELTNLKHRFFAMCLIVGVAVMESRSSLGAVYV